ncbi:MAG: hypothetical protein AAGC49_03865 [Brevundimonas sp.]
MSRGLLALALAVGAGAVAAPAALAASDDQVTVSVEIPAAHEFVVDDAQLRWGLNDEASSGAHAFGCNFLSAGEAGDAGSSHAWTAADDLYHSRSGGVRIEKQRADGTYELATWATKCLDARGEAVTTSPLSPTTQSQVVIDGGAGVVDQRAGRATIRWRGSFTVAMYGGLTYWTASDPVLEVVDGVGTLTATGSGYATSREDASVWSRVEPRPITLATFERLDLGIAGFTVAPDYVGVAAGVDQPARTAENAEFWGSFPRDFVAFQQLTGQSSYWYTSGGARDRFKVALPVTVSYDADEPVTPPSTGPQPTPKPTPSEPAVTPPDDASPGTGTPAAGGGGGGPVTGQPVNATVDPQGIPVVASASLTATTPLIPVAAGATGWDATRDPLLLAGLALLAIGAVVGAVGFRRGWLAWPWK